ncbi:MAG: SusE domain-containing protein [Flavobacteriales bacterium]|nr:SusE domain-containing protein [Flavobacteriales bacterium]
MSFTFIVFSCSDDEDKSIADRNISPVMLEVENDNVVLDKHFPDNIGVTMFWEDANYNTPTEINYTIELSNNMEFTEDEENSLYVTELGTATESLRTQSYTVKQFNEALTKMKYVPFVESIVYVRVVSSLGPNRLLKDYSNTIPMNVTPYELSYPNFYGVGAAFVVEWSETSALPLYQFPDAKHLNAVYTKLTSGQPFRFLGQLAWEPDNYSINADGTRDNYKFFTTLPSDVVQDGEENMKFNGATGWYKVEVNYNDKSLSLTAADYDDSYSQLYLVGTFNNWSQTAGDYPLTQVSTGVYSTTMEIPDSTEFKITADLSWDTQWGNIGNDNHGYSGFLGANGDNGNIKFDGGGNTYIITVNLNLGTISIVQ